jgi:hypothetical protein
MPDWILRPEFLAALATILLAIFAAVQMGLAMRQARQTATAARIEVKGPAWLARRLLERDLADAMNAEMDYFRWCWSRTRTGFADIERQMLDVLRLGATAKGKTARAAERAFERFLDYEDRVRDVSMVQMSGRAEGGGLFHSDAERDRSRQLGDDAMQHLEAAIAELANLTPRTRHEVPR